MKRMVTASAAVVLAAVLAACGAGSTTGQAAPTTVPIADVSVTAAVDWEARTVEVTGLDGYEIEFCEGEGPFLCASEDGKWIGGIELVSFPDGDRTLADGADAWTEELFATIRADREVGCGAGYEVVGDAPAPMAFAGGDGFRYGFTGTLDGRRVEWFVAHAGVVDGDLHILALTGLADDGCLGREGEPPLDAVEDLVPALAALAAGSTNLPSVDVSPPADGATTPPAAGEEGAEQSGWLRGRSDEGFVDVDAAVMLSGDEAVAAAREDGAMPPGETTLPNDFYIDDDEASIRTLPLSDELVVELYDCTAGCELRQVATADFLAHRVQPFGGEHALVSLDVEDGIVVHIREIYVP